MSDYTDFDRREFLYALDESDVEVTDWEAGFIDGVKEEVFYTTRQREKIDQLIERYEGRVKW